jgi:hypothetical protein
MGKHTIQAIFRNQQKAGYAFLYKRMTKNPKKPKKPVVLLPIEKLLKSYIGSKTLGFLGFLGQKQDYLIVAKNGVKRWT